MLFIPVEYGYWKQKETWDGTYTIDDLMDILEVIQVKNENERRLAEVNKIEQEMRKSGGY